MCARLGPCRGYKTKIVLPTCAIVPAFDAAATVGRVIDDLREALDVGVIVVDDGSTDSTGYIAAGHGAQVVRHERNLGKGAAILSGLREAVAQGIRLAVTVDADGQHPASSARRILEGCADPRTLVLGVRNLLRDGAPRSNRFGNWTSNLFLSVFSGRRLHDTQCGLRRYPVVETLALGTRSLGYAFEAEVLLRATAAKLPLIEVPIDVIYPSDGERRSHFHNVRDPIRIVAAVARTALELRLHAR